MASINTKIDWMTITVKFDEPDVLSDMEWLNVSKKFAIEMLEMLSITDGNIVLREHPDRFYDYVYMHQQSGAYIHVAKRSFTQGLKFIASGKVCDKLDCNTILASALDHNMRITRCDFAIDCLDCGETVEEVKVHYDMFKRDGNVKTTFITDAKKESTLYVGSRKSARMFRVYNKAAEQKLPSSVDWVRIEMEVKDKLTNHAVSQYLKDRRFVYNEYVELFNNWKTDTLCDIMINKLIEYEPKGAKLERTKGKRQLWLEGDVRQAIVKEYRENPEWVKQYIGVLTDSIERGIL